MVELVEYSSLDDYKLGANGKVTIILDKPASSLIRDVRGKIRKARGERFVAYEIRKDGEVAYRMPMR